MTCNLLPEDCAKQYKAVKKGDFETAKLIHYKLLEINEALFFETNPIPVKAALGMMGLIEEEYRLPLVPMTSTNRDRLKKVMQDVGLLF